MGDDRAGGFAGILTACTARWPGARPGLLVCGMVMVLLALPLTVIRVKDSLYRAKAVTAAYIHGTEFAIGTPLQAIEARPDEGRNGIPDENHARLFERRWANSR
ncbi:hypothetical protein ACLB6G_10430 [Zhengella sp. ZM62]|uniref:hypothetical protein n=1 Tax=Zhengella sedimenti TaxID=3390035 RepID=UPI003976A170